MIRNKILLVQCCNLQQFFYLAEELRKQHPDWKIDLLVQSHPDIHFYLNHFRWTDFHTLSGRENDFTDFGAVVLPLLNRGYARLKKRAWAIHATKLQVDYLGNLKKLNAFELALSILRISHKPTKEFEDFVRQFPFPELGKHVLIVESCPPSLIRETAGKLESVLPADARLHWLRQGSFIEHWKKLRLERIDGAVIYLSSDKRSLGLRLLPFLLRVKNILVVSENGDFSSGHLRDLTRFFYRRYSHGARFFQRAPRVLFLQTEGPEHTARCLKRLREGALFPNARILLICREEDRDELGSLEGVERAVCWKQDRRISQAWAIWKQIKKFKPELNCATFTGRPIFRIQKTAFFLLGARQKLALNANQDAYWISLGTVHRIFKKEPLQISYGEPTEVLLLETSGAESMAEALRALQNAKVVPNARITLFCREDKADFFEGHPRVVQSVTYSRQSPLKNLWTICKLFKIKPDVLAAVFSGSKIFFKHRLLFWLLPARNRLAFNQNLDCFYVRRTTFHLLFRQTSGTPQSLLRSALRGVLFLPRFLYLIAWWAGWKLGFTRTK